MSLTGRLGTPQSQPGQSELGSPGAPLTQRSVPATGYFKATSSRTVPATGVFSQGIHVSQAAIEVAFTGTPQARVSQAAIEALIVGTPNVRVSQGAIEVLFHFQSTRTVPASAALLATQARTVPASARLRQSSTRTVPASADFVQSYSRTVPASAYFSKGRTIPASAYFLKTQSRTVPASAVWLNGRRTVPASAALKATLKATVPAYGLFAPVGYVFTLRRDVPASAYFTPAGGGLRTVPASAQFRRIYTFARSVPAQAELGWWRTVPVSAAFRRTMPGRVVPATGCIGFRREVPASARFRRTFSRTVPARGVFGQNSRSVPASAAFWKPLTSWQAWSGTKYALAPVPVAWMPSTSYALGTVVHPIYPSPNGHIYVVIQAGISGLSEPSWPIAPGGTVVDGTVIWQEIGVMPPPPSPTALMSRGMSQASHIVGGGTYLLEFTNTPEAINAPPPAGWAGPGFDDTGWPHPVMTGNEIVPWPYGDARVQSLNFDWRWPTAAAPETPMNPTGDISLTYYPVGPHEGLWTDPWDEQIMWRIVLGLPEDPVLRAGIVEGTLVVGCIGFLARIFQVTLNGLDLPLREIDQGNINAALIGTWRIPPTYLRGGDNVFGVVTGSYLGFPGELFSRRFEYLLTINYTPPPIVYWPSAYVSG